MKDYDAKEYWIKQFSIGIHVPSGLEQDLSQSFRDSKLYSNISFVHAFTFLKMEISCWGITAELWFLMIQEMEHLRIYCSPECPFGLKLVFTREPELD